MSFELGQPQVGYSAPLQYSTPLAYRGTLGNVPERLYTMAMGGVDRQGDGFPDVLLLPLVGFGSPVIYGAPVLHGGTVGYAAPIS